MGSDPEDEKRGVMVGIDEQPQRQVKVNAYYIDKYEVTNEQYQRFIDATDNKTPFDWQDRKYPEGEGDWPVSHIDWFDARTYCEWSGKRLPTEEEWEKAARGPDGNIYPWGNEFDKKKGNFFGQPAPVGSFETDRSHYGVYDMAGNVMEWVDSWYKAYPGNKADIKDYGEKHKVLRGNAASADGHYGMTSVFARGSNRTYYLPGGAGFDGGFRCARDAEVKAR